MFKIFLDLNKYIRTTDHNVVVNINYLCTETNKDELYGEQRAGMQPASDVDN